MRLVLVPFFLLLCFTFGQIDSKTIQQCKDWACFIPKECVGKAAGELQPLMFDDIVTDEDCHAFLMIRPYSESRWLVVLESWSQDISTLSVNQGTNELFSCTSNGMISIASSNLPGFEDITHPTDVPLHCKMFVGEESGALVVKNKVKNIEILTNDDTITPSGVLDTSLLNSVNAKKTCNPANILFDTKVAKGETAEMVKATLNTVTCSGPPYSLQYYNPSTTTFEDASIMQCQQTTPGVFEYRIEFSDGRTIDEGGQFTARCRARTCSFCTDQPSTSPNKIAPAFSNKDGCFSLTCPRFFRIGGSAETAKVTAEPAVCSKVGDSHKFKIGETVLLPSVEVECVDTIECPKFSNSTCNGECFLNAASNMPQCGEGFTLAGNIQDNETIENINVTCDGDTGTLKYLKVDSFVDLPVDATFSCNAVKSSSRIAAASMPAPLQSALFVCTFLSAVLVATAAYLVYKKQRENKADKKPTS